jgi:flavodoxin
MKRIIKMQMLLSFFLVLASCSSSQMKDDGTKVPAVKDSGSILIVYLSRTNNTKAVAEMIHKKVGGSLLEIELEKPYPENYQAIVQQVAKENETGFLPPLKTRIDSIHKYDMIFIGSPTWGMQLPPPIKSILKQYDFSGK